jgi:hypothetical protein
MKVELAFPIDNTDNDLKTLDLKLTLKDLNEAKQIAGGQKAQAELTRLTDAAEGR